MGKKDKYQCIEIFYKLIPNIRMHWGKSGAFRVKTKPILKEKKTYTSGLCTS